MSTRKHNNPSEKQKGHVPVGQDHGEQDHTPVHRGIKATPTARRWGGVGPIGPMTAGVLIMAAATALVVLQSSRVRAKLTRAYKESTRTAGTARRPGMSQREIMEKALHMKQEAGPLTRIPEYQTAHQGGVQGGQVGYTDTALVREGTFTENTGRSHGARVGDSGKTTGPGR